MPSDPIPPRPAPHETPPVLPPPIISANAPPLPPGSESPSRQVSVMLRGRLHPFTLILVLVAGVRGFLIPAALVFFSGSKTGLGAVLLVFLAVTLIQAVARYFTFSYRIEGGELVTRQGIVERTERKIPLSRVQDLRIEQGLLQRLLGVVEVHVETAGGQGAEASLSVLSKSEAENLRRAVFPAGVVSAPSAATTAALPAPPSGTVIRHLSLRDLVLAGLTSNRATSAFVVIFALWQLVDDVLPQAVYERFVRGISQSIEHYLLQGGQQAGWTPVLVLALGALVVGTIISVIGSIILFHDFKLVQKGEDLQRSYGLLTRRNSSLPRRRIQVLKIEESWLRRLFGLATLRADTAGSRTSNEEARDGRDVLLPVIPSRDVEELLPVFFKDSPPSGQTDWQRVSPRAIRRGTVRGTLLCLLATLILWVLNRNPHALWLLTLIPLIYWGNVLSYRHLGYSLGETLFRARRGWLGRSTHIVPMRNIQVLVITETPFDRRHGLATLTVDTAGQTHTGGGPKIRNLPRTEAERLARDLARRAAEMRYRW